MSTELPYIRVPVSALKDAGLPLPEQGYEDRDNFVRNLVTVLLGEAVTAEPIVRVTRQSHLSRSAMDAEPLLTLGQIKMHLRIDQTAEDEYLISLEMAARLHTSNSLRRELDETAPENIKQACLLLIAHWYRNREAVSAGAMEPVPLAYEALLAPERDYPIY